MQMPAQHCEYGSALVFCNRRGHIYFFPSGNGEFCGRRAGEVKWEVITCVSPIAIVLVTFYYFIPFFIKRGAPDSLGRLRPFLLPGAVVAISAGFYCLWRSKQSGSPASRLSISVLWVSAIVAVSMILFPQAIANFLATSMRN